MVLPWDMKTPDERNGWGRNLRSVGVGKQIQKLRNFSTPIEPWRDGQLEAGNAESRKFFVPADRGKSLSKRSPVDSSVPLDSPP